jgi:ribosome recycling factor
MQKAVDVFYNQLLAIRPGAVSATMVENIKVNGTAILHIASVSEGKAIIIRPFNYTDCGPIQKTLEAAGHSCYVAKNVVMVNIPTFLTSADKEKAIALALTDKYVSQAVTLSNNKVKHL